MYYFLNHRLEGKYELISRVSVNLCAEVRCFKIVKKKKQRKNAAIMIFFLRLFCLEIVYRSNCPICLVAHICQGGLELDNFTHKHKDCFCQIWKKMYTIVSVKKSHFWLIIRYCSGNFNKLTKSQGTELNTKNVQSTNQKLHHLQEV